MVNKSPRHGKPAVNLLTWRVMWKFPALLMTWTPVHNFRSPQWTNMTSARANITCWPHEVASHEPELTNLFTLSLLHFSILLIKLGLRINQLDRKLFHDHIEVRPFRNLMMCRMLILLSNKQLLLLQVHFPSLGQHSLDYIGQGVSVLTYILMAVMQCYSCLGVPVLPITK